MEMVLPKPAVMTVVEALVESAQPAKLAAAAPVPANPTVEAVNVVMMVVVTNLVALAQALKLAPTEFVWEQLLLNVLEESVAQTELEAVVVLAPLDKDVEEDNASATMTVKRETVETLFKQLEPTLDCVPQELVELVLKVSLVIPTEDVPNLLLVRSL
jgi:hypothetical protein